ncbi:MAG: Spo0B domain-containing protein [Clostridia bacterium]|nr:Spo0B domain-containing protein [Clostridia bacterium]
MEIISDLLKLLAHQRHDFLNCLQIIQGYWQLQQPDKAKAYSKKFSQDMQAFSHLHNLKEPELLAVLLIGIQESLKLEMKIQPLKPALKLTETATKALLEFWRSLKNCELIFKAQVEGEFIRLTWIRRQGQMINSEAWKRLESCLRPVGGQVGQQAGESWILWPVQSERSD